MFAEMLGAGVFCWLVGVAAALSQGSRSGKRFYMAEEQVNFFKAFLECQASGLTLAAINTQEEERDLLAFIKDDKGKADEGNGFWLSGTNLADTGSSTYYWLTGGKRALYTNWLPGEPNNAGGNEHCLNWKLMNGQTGWNDAVCSNNAKYICQDPE